MKGIWLPLLAIGPAKQGDVLTTRIGRAQMKAQPTGGPRV